MWKRWRQRRHPLSDVIFFSWAVILFQFTLLPSLVSTIKCQPDSAAQGDTATGHILLTKSSLFWYGNF